jgi:hypothetical protein
MMKADHAALAHTHVSGSTSQPRCEGAAVASSSKWGGVAGRVERFSGALEEMPIGERKHADADHAEGKREQAHDERNQS